MYLFFVNKNTNTRSLHFVRFVTQKYFFREIAGEIFPSTNALKDDTMLPVALRLPKVDHIYMWSAT